METPADNSSSNIKQNIFNRVKSIFHHLRWFFCLSTSSQDNDQPGSNINNIKNIKNNNIITTNNKNNNNNNKILQQKELTQLNNILSLASNIKDITSFNDLPLECKLKIFSNLTTLQKGQCRQVCSDWSELLMDATLWKELDLTSIQFVCRCSARCFKLSQADALTSSNSSSQMLSVICKNQECYKNYRVKLRKFADFIAGIQPHVHSLKFSIDLIDCSDWVEMLHNFIDSIDVENLCVAYIDWTRRAFRAASPPSLSSSLSSTSSLLLSSSLSSLSSQAINVIGAARGDVFNNDNNINVNHNNVINFNNINFDNIDFRENQNDIALKQRRRLRRFDLFFDNFTQVAYQLQCLTLPFEWTEKSVRMLCRLEKLKSLVLMKCQHSITKLELRYLDTLLVSMPHLQHLTVEADLSEFLNVELWSISSNSLTSLDLQNCSCINITKMNIPNLISIKLMEKQRRDRLGERMRNNDDEYHEGDDNFGDSVFPSICLHEVLKIGAPHLKFINNFKLGRDWRCACDNELDVLIGRLCGCSGHYRHPLPLQ
ncbi:hypothetical protein HELRODRAFT_159456 [Helobdella robusta]|uniref:F-box domain-containing protein n=1 Tax=Helobdella robusta TaxID=6412 RepID=T1EP21_HELRO|nr:hypothetical protein HELRODRAFT_159456 [Helobdella robusta]ESO12868.1 hypothetical protein HELRODRAFT_159456 [Helobdella robusta]